MEGLVVDPAFWRGRRVFVTGHTGFKGSWLTFWLRRMGAQVSGYALAPETQPSLFQVLGLDGHPDDVLADIGEAERVRERIRLFQPEIVLHLAAQALVRRSYDEPVETFATNVVGTAAVLDAVRAAPSVKAVVVVTSDKCYDNREWDWPYREIDPLGGRDPYSASKGAAEIVIDSMRRSFFAPYRPGAHPARIASVRAGNVIGGGDWSTDRLIPDIIRACLGEGAAVKLRSPHAVRPWQHVLEPVAAYLALAQRLCTAEAGVDEAFNIGPSDSDCRPVADVTRQLIDALGAGALDYDANDANPHEAQLLRLDCSKARARLGWRPRLSLERAIAMTAEWYKRVDAGEDAAAVTAEQIAEFEALSPA
ncbi:MAG TPA: CDP-glucose 4,6-dehydratase [Caulobacteraceae bacterium]|nr:CDP-glucose 4,6-dehydratase [Caulobacteraceae bacterium]